MLTLNIFVFTRYYGTTDFLLNLKTTFSYPILAGILTAFSNILHNVQMVNCLALTIVGLRNIQNS